MNLYVVKYRFEVEKLGELIQSTNSLQGDGVNVVGAWNLIGPREGYAVIEADKLENLARFLERWVNHLDMEVYPAKKAQELWS